MENNNHLNKIKKMNNLIEFLVNLDPFDKDLDEFLSSLLRELMILVPEADCGSVLVYEKNGKVRFVDAVCHDLKALKKLELNEKEFLLPKNEVLLVKDTLELHSKETKRKLASAIKPLKESLVFDLRINGQNVAGMGIDILKEKEKHFSARSIVVTKLFKNLASNAFRIKLLEEELMKTNKKFKLMSDFSPVGIVLVNSNFTFSYVNKMACKMSGYTSDELLKMHFWELIHPDFVEMVKERGIKRLNGAPAIKEYAVKIITKNKEEKWVDLRSKRIELFGQNMLLVSALNVDELKRVQEDMKRIMQRYELALEASQISVFEYDVKNEMIEISREMFTQLGFKNKKFKGPFKEFKKMVHPDDIDKAFASFKSHLKGEMERFQTEYRIRSKDNSWQWISINGKTIERDEKGKPLKIFGIMSNVTEQKETQEKLKRYATYDELTGVYNRRTGLAILKEKMKSSVRSGQPLSICFLDINNLKHVNDSFGHAAGDELINTSVNLILDNIRESDVLCRVGGDEFLLIFPACTIENSEKKWSKIKKAIKDENESTKRPYTIAISHGCAQYDYAYSQDEFIAVADMKMYDEKRKMKSSSKYSDSFR